MRFRRLHTYRRARRVSEVPGSAEGGLDAPRALPALILWAQALLAEPSQCFISCQSTGNSLPPQQACELTTPCGQNRLITLIAEDKGQACLWVKLSLHGVSH